MIALILCWRSIHLAAINFQLLNFADSTSVKTQCCTYCLWKINHISAFHVSPVLDLISTLNWSDSASSKHQHGGYLFDDEMMRQILVKTRKHIGKKVCQRHQGKATFFFIWVFFHNHSRITGYQGKGEGISLTPHYHHHPLHRHLDISQAITAESSPLHISSSRTWTGNLWFSAQVAKGQFHTIRIGKKTKPTECA